MRRRANGARPAGPRDEKATNGVDNVTEDSIRDTDVPSVRDTAMAAGVGMPQRRRGAAAAHKMPRLASFSDLPDYLKDNEFIVGSYRPGGQSLWSSLRSVWGLHNETGNVWTHLLGELAAAVEGQPRPRSTCGEAATPDILRSPSKPLHPVTCCQ